ncbi:hypothetical protein BDV19DRAFT_238022 [Aspergillus venezuelensis]
MSTISDLFQRCLKQLTILISHDALAHTETGVPIRAWKDELGRLRIWAANIGAHQRGQSSLDYRLRDASHIKLQTIKVLEAIKELLDDIGDLLSKSTEQDEVAPDEELELQSLCADLELDLGDSSSEETELQGAHNSLVTKISQLFDISMIIRQPSHHDRLIGTEKVDGMPFEFHFKQHVSHKYSEAEQPLVDRIGSAMAKQKAILKYRERHHQKLGQGLNASDGDSATIKLSETVATFFHGEEIHGSISDDHISESGLSFTSYAGSLLAGHEKLGIPPMPKEGTAQKPFECPYCFFIITIKDRRAWARHIFRDLSPYICIFPDCSMGSKLYDSRKSWHRHVQDKHLSAEGTTRSYECPLCKESSLPSNSFEKHVGRHLEELSLFVLPRAAEEEDVDEDEDKDEHESQSHSESVPEPLSEASPHETSLEPNELDSTPTMTVFGPSYTTDQTIEIPGGVVAGQREEDKARLEENEENEEDDVDDLSETLPQEHEIERLKQKPPRQRGKEMARLEGEREGEKGAINLRLRLLQNYEEKERLEEEKRKAERRNRLEKLEKKEKEAGGEESKRQILRDRFTELRQRLGEDVEGERIKDKTLSEQAVEEWKLAEERRRIAEREKEEKAELEFRESLKSRYNFTEELNRFVEREKREKKEQEKDQDPSKTWVRVHRKHLLPDTLIAYHLPWAWDEEDGNYLIIKKRISPELQDELFAHTRRLRDSRLKTYTAVDLSSFYERRKKKYN